MFNRWVFRTYYYQTNSRVSYIYQIYFLNYLKKKLNENYDIIYTEVLFY